MSVNITEEFVHQLMAQIDFLTKQNSALTATVDNMNLTIAELNQTIKELKEQLNKNSKNSSKPPSSDGLKKPAVKNMVTRCAGSLKDTYEQIRLKMITLGLIHCDETGSHVDGKTCWVHVASDQDYTYLTINRKRGQIGMDAANVLPHIQGIIVHDCWGSYLREQRAKVRACTRPWRLPR